MRARCRPQVTALTARPYVERGITVCSAWQNSFTEFRSWALTHGYRDDLSLDRVINYCGYSPENCRWVTKSEQDANRRPAAEWRLPQRKIEHSAYPHIRGLRAAGSTYASIAADYQVSQATIHRIVHLSKES